MSKSINWRGRRLLQNKKSPKRKVCVEQDRETLIGGVASQRYLARGYLAVFIAACTITANVVLWVSGCRLLL